jgi:hypothetical protein
MCLVKESEIVARQEGKVKKLVSIFFVVAALCAVLVVPAAAGNPIPVSGWSFDGDYYELIELRPVGKGEDEHYCQVTVEVSSILVGDIEGDLFEHFEILQRGPCGGGPGSAPSVQRAWGTFTGEMWDGEQMRSGTCKTFWNGGWTWAEDGVSLYFEGRQTLHKCAGGLKGAHAQFDLTWVPGAGPPSYAGRAFYNSAP